MTIKVKICGIRNLSSALAAVSAGADFLGFIFVASSPRCIDVTTAFQIVNQLSVKVNTVGVFQNASTTTINSVAFKLNLDYVQLHGQEDNRLIKKIATPVIKTVFPKDNPYQYTHAKYLLLEHFDLQTAAQVNTTQDIFIAGGLTAKNVTAAVSAVKPYAVDVASGVETDGHTDTNKVIQFINQTKNYV